MTIPNIPEEAIEAATAALINAELSVGSWTKRDVARAALEAAAPFIAAQVWDEGHEIGAAEYWENSTPTNPYHKEASIDCA